MFVSALNKLIKTFIVLISLILVVCVVWQVISRYILGSPSIVTDEVARFLFMWVGLIGAAYATGQKQHLAIDLLLMKQKGKRKIWLEMLILSVMAFFAGVVLCYGGMNLVQDTYQSGQISPSLGISMGLVYLCLPIAGSIMLLYLLVDFKEKLHQLRGEK